MIGRLRRYLAGTGLGPTLVKAVTGSAGLRIAGMGFGFLVGVQLARGLGAEGYGIYGVAMSIIALLTVPTEFGLPQLLTREVAVAKVERDWGRMKGILRWSSRVSLLLSAVIGVGVVAWLLLSGRRLNSPLGMTLLAGVLMVPVVAQLSIRAAVLRGLQLIVRGQLPDVMLRPMFYSALLLLAALWFTPMTPAVAMALGVLSAALALLVAQLMLRGQMPVEVMAAVPVQEAGAWLNSTLPMAMTEGLRLLQSHLLILVIGVMATAADVGVYRVAASVGLVLALPAGLFAAVGAPVIARLHAAGDRARLQRLLGWVALGMTVGALVLTLPFILGGESLFARMFGPEFAASAPVLLVIATGQVASSLFGANAALLNMTGHQGAVTKASTLSLLLLLFIAVPLIHFHGVMGAAIANAVALFMWKVILWNFARQRTSLRSTVLAVFADKRFPGKSP